MCFSASRKGSSKCRSVLLNRFVQKAAKSPSFSWTAGHPFCALRRKAVIADVPVVVDQEAGPTGRLMFLALQQAVRKIDARKAILFIAAEPGGFHLVLGQVGERHLDSLFALAFRDGRELDRRIGLLLLRRNRRARDLVQEVERRGFEVLRRGERVAEPVRSLFCRQFLVPRSGHPGNASGISDRGVDVAGRIIKFLGEPARIAERA